MGIDRIGKGGGAGVPNAPQGAGRSSETGRPFEVRTEKTAAPSSPADSATAARVGSVAPAAPTPLDRLHAGEIDVNTYVDLKVEQATAHLAGLPPADLDAIKKMLRDQLSTDPALVDLVKHATGAAPSPPEDS